MNFTDSTAIVTLRGGITTDVALAAESGGRSTLNVGDGSIVNSVQGHWSAVNVNGSGAVGSIQGDGADNSFFFGSSASWNPNITIDGGNSSDILAFWGFIFTENDATIDLEKASLTNIESLLFPGVNNTLLVDADALAGFTTIIGSAGSKIVTSELALDLSGKAVTGLSVHSSNAAGTTFSVSDKATAFQVYGGAGSDTLQISNFAFTLHGTHRCVREFLDRDHHRPVGDISFPQLQRSAGGGCRYRSVDHSKRRCRRFILSHPQRFRHGRGQ